MHFSAADVSSVLNYADLIPQMQTALSEFSQKRVIQPLRTLLQSSPDGRYGIMSAVYGNVMGTKMVTIYPGNGVFHLPTHASVIQLFDTATGRPLATMDADVITEMRTAAVSALAAHVLAPESSTKLAILGAGVQARAHLKALRHTRHFDQVFLWSRNRQSAARLASECKVLLAESVVDAVRSADIVVVATGATSPVLHGRHLKIASLVIAIGAVHPLARELDDGVMHGALIVDSREAAQMESGDVILSGAIVYAELGQILAGHLPVPPAPRRVFKSVGIAVEDVAAAHLVYTRLAGARSSL